MIRYLHDVNAYVEEDDRYQADSVVVKLDEGACKITVFPVDTEGEIIGENSPIVDMTCANLTEAIAYYEEMIHQIEQGDVLRNL